MSFDFLRCDAKAISLQEEPRKGVACRKRCVLSARTISGVRCMNCLFIIRSISGILINGYLECRLRRAYDELERPTPNFGLFFPSVLVVLWKCHYFPC